jgi:hypothetical protein
MVTSPINPMRYWKLEEIQRMLNAIEGYENVVIEFQYTPSEGKGWHSDHWDCTCGIKEQLVNGQWNWLLKYKFQINDKSEPGEVRLAAFQEIAERLTIDVWRTSINSFRNEQQQRMTNKKINYSDPLPRETLDELLVNAERTADNLEQQINKTNMTDNGTKIIINTQTNTDTSNTNTTDENIPTWKKLYKSFVVMMITFMFVYTGSNVIIWLYDTLGMEHIMPTLIGIIIWILVYDHMYGTASKAPRIK